MKNLVRACLLLFVAALALGAAAPQGAAPAEKPPAQDPGATPGETIAILHTSMGDITVGFYPDKAPNHVENFLDLARSGFYDGTLFHRVIKGFMIQGGDPLSKDDDPRNDGTGNGPRRLKAEFNDISHVRGVLSMARSSHPDSASCQFFIMHQTKTHLDGKYTAFGHVLEGMDVVDKIAETPTGPGDRPIEPVVIKSIEVTTR